jgi:hypothetical protein
MRFFQDTLGLPSITLSFGDGVLLRSSRWPHVIMTIRELRPNVTTVILNFKSQNLKLFLLLCFRVTMNVELNVFAFIVVV